MSPRRLNLAGIAADADTMTETEVYFETPEWAALVEWLAWHGVDAKSVPAGTRVSRDECGRCIRYVGIVENPDGTRRFHPPDDRDQFGRYVVEARVEQGEAPPLPWPDLIARQLR